MRGITKTPLFPRLDEVTFKALPAPHRRAASSMLSEITDRIRGEFVEMRGFSPTVEQAARLFQVSRDECLGVLRHLVDEGFLKQTDDGRYRLPSQQ